VGTKKKENIDNLKNDGQGYRGKKEPRKVLDYDFSIKELGEDSPPGVYNLKNEAVPKLIDRALSAQGFGTASIV
jgi:hypothetical protein